MSDDFDELSTLISPLKQETPGRDLAPDRFVTKGNKVDFQLQSKP